MFVYRYVCVCVCALSGIVSFFAVFFIGFILQGARVSFFLSVFATAGSVVCLSHVCVCLCRNCVAHVYVHCNLIPYRNVMNRCCLANKSHRFRLDSVLNEQPNQWICICECMRGYRVACATFHGFTFRQKSLWVFDFMLFVTENKKGHEKRKRHKNRDTHREKERERDTERKWTSRTSK